MKEPMNYFEDLFLDRGLWDAVHHPSLENIDDKDFHQRREAFINAGNDLIEYVEKKRGEEKETARKEAEEKEGSEKA